MMLVMAVEEGEVKSESTCNLFERYHACVHYCHCHLTQSYCFDYTELEDKEDGVVVVVWVVVAVVVPN